jgi:hypothetical protein
MTIDELRELGEPNVDNWHDADGEIDSLLVAKDKARADRELLAAARNHWDALLAIAEAAEGMIADQDALYSVCLWCDGTSPMHDADCEYRILRSALDALTPKEDDK